MNPFVPAYRSGVPERDQETEEVQPREEHPLGRQERQGSLADDQEDAATSEGAGKVQHPSSSGRGVHEVLSGMHHAKRWTEIVSDFLAYQD